jgi:hypothetical protein
MPVYGAPPSARCLTSRKPQDETGASPLGCVDGLITIPGPDGPELYACTGHCCTGRDAA